MGVCLKALACHYDNIITLYHIAYLSSVCVVMSPWKIFAWIILQVVIHVSIATSIKSSPQHIRASFLQCCVRVTSRGMCKGAGLRMRSVALMDGACVACMPTALRYAKPLRNCRILLRSAIA